jgi:hypothetical protein
MAPPALKADAIRDNPDLKAPPPVFAQVLILKILKVLCFDALLQVLILKAVTALWFFAETEFSGTALRGRRIELGIKG